MSATSNASGVWPVGYRVLVKPDDVEQTTKGGIVIAETIREGHSNAQTTGRLVAAGPDCWREFQGKWAKVGDKVLFARHGGLLIHGMDGQDYRLLNDEQISAVVDFRFDNSEVANIEKRRAL